MCQCAICKHKFDSQWLNRLTNVTKQGNTNVTSHIHVCGECEKEKAYFKLEWEEGTFAIDHEGKTYMYNEFNN